jgi:hypothetical protein
MVMTVIVVILHRRIGRGRYGHLSVTLRGEVVRSGSEKIIADWFTRHGIACQYEPPLFDGHIFRRVKFSADFLLPPSTPMSNTGGSHSPREATPRK